jgi:hypothetical protein
MIRKLHPSVHDETTSAKHGKSNLKFPFHSEDTVSSNLIDDAYVPPAFLANVRFEFNPF